jgi:hypothetical protein
VIGLIAVLLASSAAPVAMPTADEFIRRMQALSEVAQVMTTTCIRHTLEHSDLESSLNGNPAFLPYNEEQAKEFLHGYQGKAWGAKGSQSAYVVTQTSSGICAVNAQTADRDQAANELKKLLDLLYAGQEVPLKPHQQTSNNDAPPLTGWSVYDSKTKRFYLFSVVIGKGEDPPADVVYNVVVSKVGAP